jgi:hypothetical protein
MASTKVRTGRSPWERGPKIGKVGHPSLLHRKRRMWDLRINEAPASELNAPCTTDQYAVDRTALFLSRLVAWGHAQLPSTTKRVE